MKYNQDNVFGGKREILIDGKAVVGVISTFKGTKTTGKSCIVLLHGIKFAAKPFLPK